MSSILKALRKVEDEKATLGEGSVDLAHDILKRNYKNSKTVPWAILTIFALLLIVCSAFVGWWLTGTAVVSKPEATQSVLRIPDIVQPPVVIDSPVNKPTPKLKPKAERVKPIKLQNVEAAQPAAEKTVQIPNLKIEEIVYHKSPASRLAVINGLPVMEGTDIEGVRIEEILPDSVRCSYQGVSFNKFKQTP